MNKEILQNFIQLLGTGRALSREPMNRHTTFRTGGEADFFLIPENEIELAEILKLCRTYHLPWFVMGNGSNLLVSDSGYRGVIICLYHGFMDAKVQEEELKLGAGVLLSKAAVIARNHCLTGLEFAGGIPGTIGGAIRMNAGAYGGEMSQVLTSVRTMTVTGEAADHPASELELGYRTSRLGRTGEIVLSARMKLKTGDEQLIQARMLELQKQRSDKQPLEYPSAGSTFKRPEGYFAGKLIMDCGLAGSRVGGACVSEKHCGFIINDRNASTADIVRLICHVRDQVRKKTGVTLEPEIRYLGEDAPWMQ